MLSETIEPEGSSPSQPSIAFLGPEGTYSHQAAHLTFGDSARYVAQRTIADVYHSVEESTPLGLLPQENSIYGTVTETYDLLRLEDLGRAKWIRGAVLLPVQHSLIVRKSQKIESIRKVLSHEQALGQCSQFIAKHLPEVTLVKVASTASAAAEISQNTPESDATECGVIASKFCTTMFDGLEVLHEGIQNESVNFTRFYVLANDPTSSIPLLPSSISSDQRRQALIRVTIDPRPAPSQTNGVSRPPNVLECLAALPPNLTPARVDRRPSLQPVPFQDVYFIELCERIESLGEMDNGASQGGSERADECWTKEVHSSVDQMNSLGATARVLGIW